MQTQHLDQKSDSKKLLAILPTKKNFVNFTWQVNDVCNFRCSYCNEGNWGGKHRNDNTERYIEVLDKLITNFSNKGYETFKFFFSGGEPTIWPSLLPIIRFLNERVDRPLIAVNTNLSRSLDWWKQNYHYFSDVVASFHSEFTNKNRYLENVKFLQYRMPYLALRLLLHDEKFSEVVEFGEKLKSELDNYLIEYAPLMSVLNPHSEPHIYKDDWKNDFIKNNSYNYQRKVEFSRLQSPDPMGCLEHYSDGEIKTLNSNHLVATFQNEFKGWKCWIDESIFVGPNGDISLASCSASRRIGNMNHGEIELLADPVICPEKRCNCGTDINIRKISKEYSEVKSKEKSVVPNLPVEAQL